MINTQEYTQRLQDLQHGMITTEEWMAYCASIKKSIVVPSYEQTNTQRDALGHQEDIPERTNGAMV
jgi:hypothetical protein